LHAIWKLWPYAKRLSIRRCYLEGRSKFLVVTDHNTLRHLLMQLNNKLDKRQVRYMRDLQPFVGSISLAHRKRALNKADPLSRSLDFVPQAKAPLFWNGEASSHADIRRKSRRLLEDAPLTSMTLNALRLSHELSDLVREGYSQDSFYGDEGEWTKDSWIEAIVRYFWRLNRLYTPQISELRLKLITELHDSSSACQ
jgi:hypothetical protein